jgi:hypothetical protein
MRTIWTRTLPLAVIRLYWRIVPITVRDIMSAGHGNSREAYLVIENDGGWKAFWFYAIPRVREYRRISWDGTTAWIVGYDGVADHLTWLGDLNSDTHGGPFDWEHYK